MPIHGLVAGQAWQNKNMAAGGKQAGGFTIVETLIVLAVSAMLATAILLTISGRQNKTEFQVAALSLKQRMEQIINETSNGYYPTSTNYTCTGSGVPGGTPQITAAASNSQGTNSTCIFLGKAVQFGIKTDSTSSVSKDESYATYPLAANRFSSGTTEVTNFLNAHPIAISSDGLNPLWPAGVDSIENFTTQNGLHLSYARYLDPSGNPIGAYPYKPYAVFALVDTLGNYTVNSKGGLNSSVQNLNLFDYDLSPNGLWGIAPTNSQQLVHAINGNVTGNIHTLAGDAPAVSAIQLCFISGATNDSALLTVQGKGQLSVTLKISGGNTQCS